MNPHRCEVPVATTDEGPITVSVGCVCLIGRDHDHDEMGDE